MKKWDYRVEALSSKDFDKENFVKDIKKFLSQLGLEGWELINITPTFEEAVPFALKDYALRKCLLFFKKEIE